MACSPLKNAATHLYFKMPITNALIGGWSQTSAVHVWIYPQCNVLPVTSVNCHVSCYNKVWALLKITTVFKHLFGLDKFLGLHYNCHWIQHHHCQMKIDDDGKHRHVIGENKNQWQHFPKIKKRPATRYHPPRVSPLAQHLVLTEGCSTDHGNVAVFILPIKLVHQTSG